MNDDLEKRVSELESHDTKQMGCMLSIMIPILALTAVVFWVCVYETDFFRHPAPPRTTEAKP